MRHFLALPYVEIGKFTKELRTRSGYSALGLEFLILTAARTGEIIDVKWGEVDLEKEIWTIPADHMKAGKEHRIPLSSRAIEILRSMTNQSRRKQLFKNQIFTSLIMAIMIYVAV